MAAPKIPRGATAKMVRDELTKITGMPQWKDHEYWLFFRRVRTSTFHDILNEGRKDWLNPDTKKAVDEEFIKRSKAEWKQTCEWALEGDWLDQRPDIVDWLRSAYWKGNKPQLERISDSQHQRGESFQAAGISEGRTEGGQDRSWRSVVGV